MIYGKGIDAAALCIVMRFYCFDMRCVKRIFGESERAFVGFFILGCVSVGVIILLLHWKLKIVRELAKQPRDL